jgi:UDP-glucose 4-epimerase
MPSSPICVVFGGSGFLGQRLCQSLIVSGFSVRSVSRTGRPRGASMPWWSAVEWVSADLGAETSSPAMLGADIIFHLASSTYPSTSNSDPVFDLQSNLVGTVRMLAKATDYGVRRVIFISSGGTVYGVPRVNPIPETHPTDPICSYGIQKLTIEKYLYLHHILNRLNSVVLRVSNIYGELQSLDRPLGAVSHFTQRAVHQEPIEIWGDGTIRRDYIHVDDVVDALMKSVSYTGNEHLFNIGSGLSISLNQLVDLIEERLQREVVVNYKPARSFDVPENVLDISRAERELGWKPGMSLEMGLDRMIRVASAQRLKI